MNDSNLQKTKMTKPKSKIWTKFEKYKNCRECIFHKNFSRWRNLSEAFRPFWSTKPTEIWVTTTRRCQSIDLDLSSSEHFFRFHGGPYSVPDDRIPFRPISLFFQFCDFWHFSWFSFNFHFFLSFFILFFSLFLFLHDFVVGTFSFFRNKMFWMRIWKKKLKMKQQ